MKRKAAQFEEEENRLSRLLFNSTNNFSQNVKLQLETVSDRNQKPVWVDEDDESKVNNVESNTYTEKLKQKYEALVGTPNWAKLNAISDEEDKILRTVGHLQRFKSVQLPKKFIEIKSLPNILGKNERAIMSCIEFHPKLSAALVAGSSGIVNLFSIDGDVNNKLHSFKLKKWNISTARFTPDGMEAYISSKTNHDYCEYDLVKAEPKLIQLPQVVKRAKIFQLSPDGKYIAVSDGLDEVYLISSLSKELVTVMKNSSNVESFTFSPNSLVLYCYGSEGEISLWDLKTFRVVQKFYDQGCVTASCICISPCGRLLSTGSGEGIVNIYDTSNLNNLEPLPIKTITNLTTKITNIKFNATSEILAISSSYFTNAIKLIHIPSYHVFSNFPLPSLNLHQVDTVAFSPGSGFMAIGNNTGNAYLYRLKHYKNY